MKIFQEKQTQNEKHSHEYLTCMKNFSKSDFSGFRTFSPDSNSPENVFSVMFLALSTT